MPWTTSLVVVPRDWPWLHVIVRVVFIGRHENRSIVGKDWIG
jgi:hypothetical protein